MTFQWPLSMRSFPGIQAISYSDGNILQRRPSNRQPLSSENLLVDSSHFSLVRRITIHTRTESPSSALLCTSAHPDKPRIPPLCPL